MSVNYDLFEKPDVRQTGEQQPLYARFIHKGTMEHKEFIDRVHMFTGISRSVLEGAMEAFMDELRDCLAGGWTVEMGRLGYFSPSLSCERDVMDKNEIRSASVSLRGLNFRVSKEFYQQLNGKIRFERSPQSASRSASSLPFERCRQLLEEYLRQYPCINRAQYARLAGRSVKQAINDLNEFIENGMLMRHGMGRNVVYIARQNK